MVRRHAAQVEGWWLVVCSWRAHQAGGSERGAKAHVVVVFAALEREQVQFGAFEADEHRGGGAH